MASAPENDRLIIVEAKWRGRMGKAYVLFFGDLRTDGSEKWVFFPPSKVEIVHVGLFRMPLSLAKEKNVEGYEVHGLEVPEAA